jgi:hypothetical protein
MVLSGTLQEFILADIFQILAQQKATGKLVLKNDKHTGTAVLQAGVIVCAEEDSENFQNKFANFLMTLRGIPENDVEELLAHFGGSVVRFTQEIVTRKYLEIKEVTALAQSTLEDFSCSLFSWSKGNYHFESMPEVNDFLTPGVSLPSDFIIMEAMRRLDESKRIHNKISDDVIFVATGHGAIAKPVNQETTSLLAKPDEYLMKYIDGLSTITTLVQKVFLSKTRIYETLYRLWEDDCIAPLPTKVSRSIKAAIDRKPQTYQALTPAYSVFVGILLTLATLLVIGILTVVRDTIYARQLRASHQLTEEVAVAQNTQKTAIAELEYRTLKFIPATDRSALIREGLISPRDIHGVPGSVDNESGNK